MVIHVTCKDITGHTRDELTALVKRATVRAAGPMSGDQREAVTLLLNAFACFIAERTAVPTDIRMAVAEVMNRGDGFVGFNAAGQDEQARAAA
jgi:hypothetical protein